MSLTSRGMRSMRFRRKISNSISKRYSVPRDSDNPNSSTQTVHDRKTCCLVTKGRYIFAELHYVSCNVTINVFLGLSSGDGEWNVSVPSRTVKFSMSFGVVYVTCTHGFCLLYSAYTRSQINEEGTCELPCPRVRHEKVPKSNVDSPTTPLIDSGSSSWNRDQALKSWYTKGWSSNIAILTI